MKVEVVGKKGKGSRRERRNIVKESRREGSKLWRRREGVRSTSRREDIRRREEGAKVSRRG